MLPQFPFVKTGTQHQPWMVDPVLAIPLHAHEQVVLLEVVQAAKEEACGANKPDCQSK